MGQSKNDSKLLIVDDDKFIRNQVSNAFAQLGYECITVKSSEEAREYLESNQVDVLITDIYMEKMTGIDLIDSIRDKHENLPVIVVTGDESIEIEREVREKGVYAYFLKPLEIELLKRTVQAAVNLS